MTTPVTPAISQQKFIIRSDVDIISARMAIREFARRCGFSTKDQASISIASTSLSSSMGVAQNQPSGIAILIEYFEHEQKHGIHVICTKHHVQSKDQEIIQKEMSGNSRWLVDDVRMEQSSSEGIEIIITKWDSLHTG
jgi:hypothetical protein